MRRLLALFALLALLAACGDDGDGSVDDAGEKGATTLELTEADAGSEHVVVVGAEIEISLEQCIGCGYQWALMGDADPAVIELVSEEDLEVDQDPGMVGGMTRHVKTFRASTPGAVSIALGYFPPGEQPPDEVLTFDLEIEE